MVSFCNVFSQIQKDTVFDVDGNMYHTVKIGDQIWMVEFLKTMTFADGTPIENIKVEKLWAQSESGAFCNLYNKEENVKQNGRLYNYYAINDKRAICPTGWHVPSISEWNSLDSCIKNDNKILEEKGWWSYQIHGQSLLPLGYRNENGIFSNENSLMQTNYGGWWTSDELDDSNSWIIYVGFSSYEKIEDKRHKRSGYSVICVKNK